MGFNTTDPLILGKAKIEIEQCLMQVRLKVFDSNNGQRIGYEEAIAGAFPPYVFKLFHAWLKTAPFRSAGNQSLYSFGDIYEFIRCEIVMRVMVISASDTRQYGVSDNTYLCYQSVRNVMTRADRPASARRVVHSGAQLPAFSFDPIMEEAIRACG